MEVLQLKCKNCGAPIQKEDIHLDLKLVVCSHCGAVFGPGAGELPQATPEWSEPRRAVPLPKGVEMDTDITGLKITYRWFSPKTLGLLFFAVLWDGFLVFWYGIALSGGAPSQMLLFGSLHVLVGLFITYQVLTGFLNATTIQADMGRLTIHHGPLPWPGNRDLSADALDQLYVKQQISYSRRGGRTVTYQLFARLRDGREVKLISNISNPNQGLYIEQELERYLSIPDRPMPDEYRR